MPFTPIDRSFVPDSIQAQMPNSLRTIDTSSSPSNSAQGFSGQDSDDGGVFSTLGKLGKGVVKGVADIVLQPARFLERTGKAIGQIGLSDQEKQRANEFWGKGLQEDLLGDEYNTDAYQNMEEFAGGALQTGLNLSTPFIGGGALSSFGKAAATGAGFGAAQGLGASMEQGNDAQDVFWDTLAGGAFGGLFGGAAYGVGKGVSKVAGKLSKGKVPPVGEMTPDSLPPGGGMAGEIPKSTSANVEMPISTRGKAGEYLMGPERIDEMVKPSEVPRGPSTTIREKVAGIDRSTKGVMQTKTKQDQVKALSSYDEMMTTAKKAAENERAETPLELAGSKAGSVLDILQERMKQVGTEKGDILTRTGNRPIQNVQSLVQEIDDSLSSRFGGKLDEEGKIVSAQGRRLRVSDTDAAVLSDLRREFLSLGDSPTAQMVDDTVDYMQRQLYKAKQNLTKPMDKEVIAFSKDMLSKLNKMQQETLGEGYINSNAKYRELKQVFEWLNKNLGPAGQRGGSLMKRVFSPSDAGTKKMFETIRNETGVDLVREATFAKLAMELVGDTRQANLLEQLDLMIPGSKTALVDRIIGMTEKLAKKTVDPEKVIRRMIAEGLNTADEVAGAGARAVPDVGTVPKGKAGALPAKFERASGLSPSDVQVEQKAFEKIVSKERELLDAYKKKFGNVVNTDNFRPFFADEGYVGSNSAAVQEPSSYLRKKAWAEGLQRPGEDAVLYAGGSGSGKTSAIKNIPELAEKTKNAAVILDGNLSSHDSAIKALKQAKDAKKKAPIIYVYRDPVESFVEGVVKRMNDNPEEMGRLVPSKEVAGNHIGSWETIKRLLNEEHSVIFVDNSLGAKNAKVVSFEDLNKKINYPSKEELTSLFNTKAKELLDAGKITPEQYQGYIN